MSVLQLDNVPDELMRRLEQIARRDRRTPAEAAVALLASAMTQAEAAPHTDVRATLDWIRANRVTPTPGTPDSTELLREDRRR
jgi:predicted transcriptional regulator